MAMELRDVARCSVGSVMPAKSLELQHTIRLIRGLDAEIDDIEAAIQAMMDEIQSPITTIPGIGFRMGAMILAEIGDFSRFDSLDKILAYAGMSPSAYQSGQLSLSGTYSHMKAVTDNSGRGLPDRCDPGMRDWGFQRIPPPKAALLLLWP